MKAMKKMASLVVLGAIGISTVGCGAISSTIINEVVEKVTEDTAVTLVQGNLDAMYKGIYSEEYVEMLADETEEDLVQAYEEGMLVEADYFAYYWGMYDAEYGESYEMLSESVREDILQLCKDIFAQTKYEIQESTTLSDGNYSVKVSVEPSYIMKQAEEMYDRYDDLEAFWEKYRFVNVDDMSDEEYQAYGDEYARIIIKMVRELLPEMKYMDAKTQMIQVEEDENGVLFINEDDWNVFNGYIVYYP